MLSGFAPGQEVFVAIRYERVEVVPVSAGGAGLDGTMIEESYRGPTLQRRIDLGPMGILLADAANTGRQTPLSPGEAVRVRWAPDGATILPARELDE